MNYIEICSCFFIACEQLVVRSFPVTSLTKDKRVTGQYLAHLNQWLQEGLQLRSCTFQVEQQCVALSVLYIGSKVYSLELTGTITSSSSSSSFLFQLMKLAFDEEVTLENIESFRKLVHRVRHPPHIFHHFAFTGQVVVPQTPLHKGKEKNATLK
jgi:myotubularin-related protein 5/13